MKKLERWDAMTPEEAAKYGIKEFQPSLTKQEMKDENDPQAIIDRYTRSGQRPPSFAAMVPKGTPPRDTTKMPTFHEAMNIITKGNEQFMTLNADVRKYFDNDPGKFLDFIGDSKNLDEGIRLGLWTKEEVKEPAIQKVEIVNPKPPEEPKK